LYCQASGWVVGSSGRVNSGCEGVDLWDAPNELLSFHSAIYQFNQMLAG